MLDTRLELRSRLRLVLRAVLRLVLHTSRVWLDLGLNLRPIPRGTLRIEVLLGAVRLPSWRLTEAKGRRFRMAQHRPHTRGRSSGTGEALLTE